MYNVVFTFDCLRIGVYLVIANKKLLVSKHGTNVKQSVPTYKRHNKIHAKFERNHLKP